MIDRFDVVVRPDGWTIPEEAIASHGITNEMAEKAGISESAAVELFFELLSCGDEGVSTVTSNKQFNNRIMRIAIKRFGSENQQNFWNKKDNKFCAVSMAKDYFDVKKLNIDDAFSHFSNEEIQAGTVGDAEKSAKVYFALNGKV